MRLLTYDRVALLVLLGRSGVGKSSVAEGLRAAYSVPILELGPLFRCAALLSTYRSHFDVRRGAAQLEAELRTGETRVDLYHSGSFAANRILRRGRQIDDQLWDRRLAPSVVQAAQDHTVKMIVQRVARDLLAGSDLAVVTGREAQLLVDERDFVIELRAADDIRRLRKGLQLELRVEAPSEIWEPQNLIRGRLDSLIDTSTAGINEVTHLVGVLANHHKLVGAA